jgi:flagellar assembly protein FliH
MTAAPARFTFDLDLGRNQDGAGFLSTAARSALLQQARADGYAEGFAAGEAGATAAAAQNLAAAAAALAEHAMALLGGEDAARHEAERNALGLALVVARKLANALLAQQPVAELDALLTDCLASLEGVPHLVIRCHSDLADKVREMATQRIASSGFSGRLIVIGDPELALGDGRVEWADGGVVRDRASIARAVDDRIAAYLAARGIPPLEETTP